MIYTNVWTTKPHISLCITSKSFPPPFIPVLINMFTCFSQDPAYSTGKFGEVRELILGMLETYNYEQVNMNPHFYSIQDLSMYFNVIYIFQREV